MKREVVEKAYGETFEWIEHRSGGRWGPVLPWSFEDKYANMISIEILDHVDSILSTIPGIDAKLISTWIRNAAHNKYGDLS
jgi:hypothetical protein